MKELLESIYANDINDEWDVVVADNASDDGTSELIRSFDERFGKITYYAHIQNLGFDANLLSLIKIATGKYLWFIGSDDFVMAGAIAKIIRLLKNNDYDGIVLNGLPFDFRLRRQLGATTVMNKVLSQRTTHFTNVESLFSELGDYLGFISANLVKKKCLSAATGDPRVSQFERGYVHIFLIGVIAKHHTNWLYLAEPTIKWRSGNDSCGHLGAYRRLALDVIEYERIMLELFGTKSVVFNEVNKRICGVITAASVLNVKLKGSVTLGYAIDVFRLTWPRYYRFYLYWIKVIPYLILPRLLVSVGLKIVRRIAAKTSP